MKLSKLFNWFNPSLGSFRVKGLIFNAPFVPVLNVYRATQKEFLQDCYLDFIKSVPNTKSYFRDEARFDKTLEEITTSSAPELVVVAPVYPPSPTKDAYTPGYENKLSKTVFYDSKDAARQPYLTSGRVSRAKNIIRVPDDRSEAQTKALATRLYVDDFVARYTPSHEKIRAVPVLSDAGDPIDYDDAVNELTDICLKGEKNRSARFEHRWQTAPFEKNNRRVVLENIGSAARTGAIMFALASKTDTWPWDTGYLPSAVVFFGSYALEGLTKHLWHRGKVLGQKRPELKFKL